jgi:anti-sigma B factor antagonist
MNPGLSWHDFEMNVDRDRLTISTSPTGWTLSGEIDAHTAPALEGAVSALPSGSDAVSLDVRDVSFIDSSGLRILIGLAKRASEARRPLRIDHPSPTVVRLIEITGLGEMFGLAGDPRDA